MSSCKDGYAGFLNFCAMKIPHFVIAGDNHPPMLVAKSNYFLVLDVFKRLAGVRLEPFRKSLNSKTGSPEPLRHRKGRKAIVEK